MPYQSGNIRRLLVRGGLSEEAARVVERMRWKEQITRHMVRRMGRMGGQLVTEAMNGDGTSRLLLRRHLTPLMLRKFDLLALENRVISSAQSNEEGGNSSGAGNVGRENSPSSTDVQVGSGKKNRRRVAVGKLPRLQVHSGEFLSGWTTPVGIELTRLPGIVTTKKFRSTGVDSGYIVSGVVNMMKAGYKLDEVPDSKMGRLHKDSHCIECASPVLNSWAKVKEWYDLVHKYGEPYDLKSHSQWETSGGGHIHVGPLKPIEKAMLMRLCYEHSYLGWVFNEPQDKDTSQPMQKYFSDYFREEIKKGYFQQVAKTGTLPKPELSYLMGWARLAGWFFLSKELFKKAGQGSSHVQEWNKQYLLTPRNDTMEFRMFEAPRNWKEQEEHIAFAQAMVMLAKEMANQEVWWRPAYKRWTDVSRMEKGVAERKFRKLIDLLGLPWSRYKHYVDENLSDRFEFVKPRKPRELFEVRNGLRI